jgi:hypothetical protein
VGRISQAGVSAVLHRDSDDSRAINHTKRAVEVSESHRIAAAREHDVPQRFCKGVPHYAELVVGGERHRDGHVSERVVVRVLDVVRVGNAEGAEARGPCENDRVDHDVIHLQ